MATTRTPLGLSARRFATELEAARIRRRPLAPPPELAQLSLSEAYDVQDALVACREAAGLTRSGWKLGLTSEVKQRVMGIERPVFGRTFGAGAVANGGLVKRAAFIAPRTEPELAFGLGGALDPSASLTEIVRAVVWVAAALEITDSRYAASKRTAVELVADNTSSAAYVLGVPVPLERAPPLATIETLILCNGAVVTAGSTADVLGNPVAGLALLARHLAERGLQTAPGDIVLSGAITDAFSVAAGDRVEARLTGLGSATVDFG